MRLRPVPRTPRPWRLLPSSDDRTRRPAQHILSTCPRRRPAMRLMHALFASLAALTLSLPARPAARRLLRPAERLRRRPRPLRPLRLLLRQSRLAMVARDRAEELVGLDVRPGDEYLARHAAVAGAAHQPAPLRRVRHGPRGDRR